MDIMRASRSASPAATGASRNDVVERVLAIVAEKTGYPPDMLEMDLDLEADLGVDTVKQAETFAAVRAPYDIPRDCDTGKVGRYRKAPSWLGSGKPLELKCHLADRGASCDGRGSSKTVSVGGRCDKEMRPVARVN